jgi:hypothetical protein
MYLPAHPTYNIDFRPAVNLDETAVFLAQNTKMLCSPALCLGDYIWNLFEEM